MIIGFSPGVKRVVLKRQIFLFPQKEKRNDDDDDDDETRIGGRAAAKNHLWWGRRAHGPGESNADRDAVARGAGRGVLSERCEKDDDDEFFFFAMRSILNFEPHWSTICATLKCDRRLSRPAERCGEEYRLSIWKNALMVLPSRASRVLTRRVFLVSFFLSPNETRENRSV